MAALDTHVEQNISFVNAHNAVLLKARWQAEMYSWEADFDKLAWPTCVEPEEL